MLVQILFWSLLFAGYIAAPVTLIWGWTLWALRPKLWTILSTLSLAGFVLASASSILGASSILYALLIHGFRYYDPRLLRIFRVGVLLSFGGSILSLAGVWHPSSLRWYSLIASIGTLAFWVAAAVGE